MFHGVIPKIQVAPFSIETRCTVRLLHALITCNVANPRYAVKISLFLSAIVLEIQVYS